MMVNETGDRIHRHRPSSLTLHIDISKHLVRNRTGNCQDTIYISLILTDPRIRKRRQLRIIVSQMPNIKRSLRFRAHLTTHTGRLIPIISPRFLITKDLIISSLTSSKNLLVKNSLLANISKDRPVIIKAILTTPETFKTLLIGMIITGNHQTKYKAMLHKGLNKIAMNIRSDRKGSSITKRGTVRLRTTTLNNLININRNTITAEVFGALETGIRRGNAKMRLEDFNVTGTTTGIFLVQLLNLESHTELINRSSRHSTIIHSPKIIRDNWLSRTRIGI